MKKNIYILILSAILFQIICSLFEISFATASITTSTNTNKDIYDVILFWGQSNMTGSCGAHKEDNLEDQPDNRYDYRDEIQVSEYSKVTGISEDILKNAEQQNYIRVNIPEGVAYEYNYIENRLIPLTGSTKIVGEQLVYDTSTKKLSSWSSGYHSIEKSRGTNIVPQFCADYYKRTGHKVVAVMASNSGEQIAHFLPYSDVQKYSLSNNNSAKQQYIYEAMVEKYNSAIKYLKSQNYKVGHKVYVSFQGESDAILVQNNKETSADYYKKFQLLHTYLNSECDISLGALIETSRSPGTYFEGVVGINIAQKNLIANNDTIILGTNYPYLHYVPDKDNYISENYNRKIYTNASGKKIDYSLALSYSLKCMCPKEPYDNSVHFTSAALSQIGRETANNISAYYDSQIISIEIKNNPTKKNYIQNQGELDLSGGSILVSYSDGTSDEISLTNTNVSVSGFNNKNLGTNTITVSYKGKQTTFDVNIISKSVSSIKIKNIPTKKNYIQNYEQLDLTGGSILVQYNDTTSDEISLTNTNVYVSGFNNKNLGTNTISVYYESKQTTFDVNIISKSVSTIKIKNIPTKKSYIQNYEQLDLTGGSILVQYNDTTSDEISLTNTNVSVSGFNNKNLGTNTITISYEGKQASFDVNIIEKSISSIEIYEEPLKHNYISFKEDLDLTGGILTVNYNDGSYSQISMSNSEVKIEGFDNTKFGEQIINVTYFDKSTSFKINILNQQEDPVPSSDTTVSLVILPFAGRYGIFILCAFILMLTFMIISGIKLKKFKF